MRPATWNYTITLMAYSDRRSTGPGTGLEPLLCGTLNTDRGNGTGTTWEFYTMYQVKVQNILVGHLSSFQSQHSLTALFTKLLDCLPPNRMASGDRSYCQLPFTANGTFFCGTVDQWNSTSKSWEAIRPADLWIAWRSNIYCLQRSCKGYVFTGVLSVHGGGVCLSACWDTTPSPPREQATVADGMYPTGMHSCFSIKPLFLVPFPIPLKLCLNKP